MYTEGKDKIRVIFSVFRPIIAIALVLILVMGTNWLGQKHFIKAYNITDSLYGDRQLSFYQVYRLNQLLHFKQQQVLVDTTFLGSSEPNRAIERSLTIIGETRLTSAESLYFNRLKKNCVNLFEFERFTFVGDNEVSERETSKWAYFLDSAFESLDDLANAKLVSHMELPERTKKSLNTNKLLLRVEIIFLVIVGAIFQLIFSGYKKH